LLHLFSNSKKKKEKKKKKTKTNETNTFFLWMYFLQIQSVVDESAPLYQSFNTLRMKSFVDAKTQKLIDTYHSQIQDLITTRIQDIESGKFVIGTNPDILTLIVQNLQDGNITEHQSHCTIVNTFTAGTLNSAMHAQFVLLHLAHDQSIQDKIRQELNEALPARQCPDDTTVLPYTTGAVKESLRLYVNGMFPLPRITTSDIQLENGSLIPKGSWMNIAMLGTHRDPDYFPEPESFKPERWDTRTHAAPVPFSFVPFGVGARACPAANMGLVNVTVFVAYMGKFLLGCAITFPLKKKKTC
jgi:cytochrome P450